MKVSIIIPVYNEQDFIKKSREDFATPSFLRFPLSKQIDGDLLGNPIPVN